MQKVKKKGRLGKEKCNQTQLLGYLYHYYFLTHTRYENKTHKK
jgi:hypothetical protein